MSANNTAPVTSQAMDVDAGLEVDWSSKTVTPASTPKNEDLLAPPEGINFDNLEGHTRSASAASGGEDTERSSLGVEARQARDKDRVNAMIADAYNARDEARAELESLCVEIVSLRGTIESMQDQLFQAKVEAVAAQRGEASSRADLKETRAENARLISRVSVLETDVAWKDNHLRSWADELDAYAAAEMKANQSGGGTKRQRNTYEERSHSLNKFQDFVVCLSLIFHDLCMKYR
jgi:chromosome segregation ATPase